jgi:hypothetical protein
MVPNRELCRIGWPQNWLHEIKLNATPIFFPDSMKRMLHEVVNIVSRSSDAPWREIDDGDVREMYGTIIVYSTSSNLMLAKQFGSKTQLERLN